MNTAYLALGTNLGDKVLNLNEAINEISKRIGRITSQSAFYTSEPWGFQSENNFVNGVIRVETELKPLELLQKTQEIEIYLGRRSKSNNQEYSDRIIDIDLLIIDQIVFENEKLTLPHPHILARDFVYVPLLEIEPSLIHPTYKKPINQLISEKHTLEKLK